MDTIQPVPSTYFNLSGWSCEKLQYLSDHQDNFTLIVFPPPVVNAGVSQLFASLYSILFFLGFVGNITILSYIYFIQNTLEEKIVTRDSIFIYIIALSLVDLSVILSLPTTIVNLLTNNWIFGKVICKFHWVLESVSKVASTLILTAISFDRYMCVCHPLKTKHFRRPFYALKIVFSAVLYSAFLLSPLVYCAEEFSMFYSKPFPFQTAELEYEKIEKIGCIEARTCMQNMEANIMTFFTIFMFSFGFILPGCMITVFYSRMLFHLAAQTRRNPNSKIPLKRIVCSTLGVTFFYFSCWIPYWISVLYRSLKQTPIDDSFVVFMWTIHALPYLNASLNWILYGLLNNQLRRYYKEAANVNNASSYSLLNFQSAPSRADTVACHSWRHKMSTPTDFHPQEENHVMVEVNHSANSAISDAEGTVFL